MYFNHAFHIKLKQTLVIKRSRFELNTANIKGGVIFISNFFYLSLLYCEFRRNEANNKNGIVSGYRKSEYYEHLSRARTFISKALRFFNTYILALPTNDTQCGLKAFDNDVKKLFVSCQTDRFLLDLELLLSVNAHKLEIHPVHVSLNEGVTFTKFNYIVLFQELGNFIKLIIKYRIYYRFIK